MPKAVEGVVFSRVSDGGVLLATEEEIYYGLNEVGARVWELMGDGRTVESICRELRGDYPDVDASTIRRDVEDLLGDLMEYGLVRRAEREG